MDIKTKQLFNNLIAGCSGFSIHSIKEGVKRLRVFQQDLEVLHICIDYPSPIVVKDKKRYFDIWKEDIATKLDEWIFDNLVEHEEYGGVSEKIFTTKR